MRIASVQLALGLEELIQEDNESVQYICFISMNLYV